MRTCELTREGISYQILQNLIEQGRIEKIKDGYYQWQDDKAISTMGNILFKSIPDAGIAIRYAEFGKDDNAEVFLRNMDDKMYEEKRRYHGAAPSIPE